MLDHRGQSDIVEIEAVIEADVRAYLARDRVAWCKSWLQNARFMSIMECGTLQVSRGFDAFRDAVFSAMDACPHPVVADVSRTHLVIDVTGDLARATFDQTVQDVGDPLAPPTFSHNVRFFERAADGTWKIAFHGVWEHRARTSSAPLLEVDETGRVLWMNPEAKTHLATFPSLTLSAGVLRAARPALDRELRAAIAKAAALRNYVLFNAASSGAQKPVGFPVLLGEDEAGGVLLAFVRISDGRIYVGFSESEKLDQQIAMAGAVFGLSDTQMALARQIVAGAGLPEAADALGVSLNTARTHLRRMFDKTGARSQIALLRVFLDFA